MTQLSQLFGLSHVFLEQIEVSGVQSNIHSSHDTPSAHVVVLYLYSEA